MDQASKKEKAQRLAQRVALGDEIALGELYELYAQVLYYFGLRVVGSEHEALIMEVIQDFFLWIASHYEKLKPINNFEAYLYRSIRHNLQQKISTKVEKQKVQQRYQLRTAPLRETTTPSPETNFIQSETTINEKQKLQQAMKQLPAYQREILHLRYFEERDYKEISEFLSISQQVARNYVYRAIQNLRKQLSFVGLVLFLMV